MKISEHREKETHIYMKKLITCYIWSIDLNDAGNWTLRKIDLNYLESSGELCWRRREKIRWNGLLKNKVLRRVKEERNVSPQ
jgi:hypothetical protein